MTKHSSSKKKPKASLEGYVVEQEKPSFKPKKEGNEIDEIFAGKKRKRTEEKNANIEKPAKVSSVNAKSHDKMRKVKNDKSKASKVNSFANPTSRPRKKTANGLAIYTEEELGIGKPEAGGTSLCPFDCDCCF